jgi:hypothetical protein
VRMRVEESQPQAAGAPPPGALGPRPN